MHEQIGSDALVEEYIEGRELYVGVLGNERLKRLPVWEMRFGSLPENAAGDRDPQGQMGPAYQQNTTSPRAPPRICRTAPVLQRLERLSRRIFRALHLSGYARIDFRVRADGACSCSRPTPTRICHTEEDFAESARAGGLGYRELLERIITLGRNYRVEWRDFNA